MNLTNPVKIVNALANNFNEITKIKNYPKSFHAKFYKPEGKKLDIPNDETEPYN